MKLLITADGSHTVLNEELNATYHPVHGALTESRHVFIDNGLDYMAKAKAGEDICVLEIGLGTGLNALLSYYYAREQGVKINYEALEPFALPDEITRQLNYNDEDGVLLQLHGLSWGEWHKVNDRFKFRKNKTALQDFDAHGLCYDLVYFDAFAFTVQPGLWELTIFAKLYELTSPGACLVTYAAKGLVKRALRQCGFAVQALPGPPRKREMMRALRS